MNALFLNGLGNGETRRREQIAFDYLKKRGLEVTHHNVAWLSGNSFEDLLQSAIKVARKLLQQKGRIAIIGSSAGGSMAVNVFSALQDDEVRIVSLCGRLHP